MSEEVVTESGGTEAPEQKFVSVEEADDVDLDAFLAGGDELAERVAPTEDLETRAPEAEPEKESDIEPETPPEKAEEPSKPSRTEEDWKKLEAQVTQQEAYIKQRNTEVGQLRGQLRVALAKLEQQGDDLETPKEAFDRLKKIDKIKEDLTSLDDEEQTAQAELIGSKILIKNLKPEEHNPDAVISMLREDGLTDENFLRALKTNPFAVVAPDTLVHMHKRAHREGMLIQIVPAFKRLLAENAELKKAKGDVNQRVAGKIQKELNRTPSMNVGQGTSSAARESTPNVDVTKMSDAELDELLARN